MKIIKITGAVIVLLILVFLSVGIIVPSVNYTSTVTVNASPEKCWSIFHDTSRMSQWTEGFESLKLVQGDSLAPGATYELIIVQDKRMVMTEKILEVERPLKIVCELDNEVLRSKYHYDFVGKGDSTRITGTFEVTGNNLLWKSLFVVMQSYFQKENSKQLEGLKKVIESNSTI